MAVQGNNARSSRPERFDTSRLFWAFTLSIAVHLFLWGGYTGGKKLGLWEKLHLPAWVQKLTKPLVLLAKPEAKPRVKESEPPLMFIDVSQHQAVTEPPKDAQFYSSLNSQAANPEAERDSKIPKITGKQEHVPKTEDAEREKFATLQPFVPAEKPEIEQRASSKPKIERGDLTLALPEEKPRTDTGNAEKPRPRRLSEVAQNKVVRPPGQKMKQDGGVKRQLPTSMVDAKGTTFGMYDALFINAVRERWYDLLENREYASEARGSVAVQFKLHHDGRITEMKVLENTVSETLSLICQKAVLDPAPFEKWSTEMRLMVGENFRKIRFTFYYN